MPGGPSPEIPELPPAFPSTRDSRTQAERLFRRALRLDPTLAEARIRLVHVLGDSGRHNDATAELKPLATERLAPFLDYYASLMRARESRALGQLDAARAAFEHAATVFPEASAPKLGLSELAMARGNRAESLAHLRRETDELPGRTTEPWWWIDRVHEPSAQFLMSELRQLISQ